MTLTSRAFHSELLGAFAERLAALTGMQAVLPMNTGAEAVETAIKTARRYAAFVRGVPEGKQNIVCCRGNFHGRTVTVVSMSTDPTARAGYGPFTPGFRAVEYGDARAIEEAIDQNTAAVLLEPIQGEAGVIVPPEGYLSAVREICSRKGVLMLADEVQTGFGRTGDMFACMHEGVQPDIYILGKALGGGIMPVSAVASTRDILGVFEPGARLRRGAQSHGDRCPRRLSRPRPREREVPATSHPLRPQSRHQRGQGQGTAHRRGIPFRSGSLCRAANKKRRAREGDPRDHRAFRASAQYAERAA